MHGDLLFFVYILFSEGYPEVTCSLSMEFETERIALPRCKNRAILAQRVNTDDDKL